MQRCLHRQRWAAQLRERQEQERIQLENRQKDLSKQRDAVLQKYREEQQRLKQQRAAPNRAQQDLQLQFQNSEPSAPTKEATGRSRIRRERKPRQPRKPRERRTHAKDIAVQGQATGTEAAANIDKAQREFEQRMRDQLRHQWDRSHDGKDR